MNLSKEKCSTSRLQLQHRKGASKSVVIGEIVIFDILLFSQHIDKLDDFGRFRLNYCESNNNNNNLLISKIRK